MSSAAVMNNAEWHKAYQVITAWKNDPSTTLACPRCDQLGFNLVDRSARPHAEWYQLDCAGCGFAAAIHIPLAPGTSF